MDESYHAQIGRDNLLIRGGRVEDSFKQRSLSLPIAGRGAKKYLRHLWEKKHFDFEKTCRSHGRNNAVFVLAERLRLRGIPEPEEKEIKKLVRIANRATGGLNQDGEKEHYTFYEARATFDQVSLMNVAGIGVYPLVERRRHWAKNSRSKFATKETRKVLNALCDVAHKCHRFEGFSASYRQLAETTGLSHMQIDRHLRVLVAAGQIRRLDSTAPFKGRERGTSRFSLKPDRPMQKVDEQEPPVWNPMTALWEWSSSLAKGTLSQASARWLAKTAANVPNVKDSSSSERKITTASAFQLLDNPLRGSP